GDSDGDGKADLAVFVATGLSGAQISGQVYVFWHIADRGTSLTLSDADAVIDSTTGSGLITAITAGLGQDLNGDRVDDLLLGAARATGTVGNVKPNAGRVYVVYGSRHAYQLPGDGVDILANYTVTGAGDYVADPGTGQPVTFDRSLNPDSAAPGQWYR